MSPRTTITMSMEKYESMQHELSELRKAINIEHVVEFRGAWYGTRYDYQGKDETLIEITDQLRKAQSMLHAENSKNYELSQENKRLRKRTVLQRLFNVVPKP